MEKMKKLKKWLGNNVVAVVSMVVLLLSVLAIFIFKLFEKEDIPNTGSDQTRGIRNNNPLNIRKTKTEWKHEVDGDDEDFETFDSMMWGVRAAFRNMYTYYHTRKLNTIEKIITRWAPPSENNTTAYIAYVCKKTKMQKDQVFDWEFETVIQIVNAMSKIESRYEIPKRILAEAWENI